MSEERNQRFLTAFSLCILIAATSTAAAGNIIYVKQGATGNGTSWTEAYGNLQNALDAAVSSDEIRVAAGTYKPTSDHGLATGDRGKHFRMINGVLIYGGFPPGGGTLADRDPNQYETILSGDIGTPGNNSDNCYHVFYHPSGTNLNTTARLYGFTITAGNANGSWPHNAGGGMCNSEGNSPTVVGCTFTGNRTFRYGGGIFNYENCSPTLAGCTFTGNSAWIGGGMYTHSSSPLLLGCTFTGNSADLLGGGMYNLSGSPTVKNCTFSGNSAGDDGGGMFNSFMSYPTLTNCTFNGNSAYNAGGGMCNALSDNSKPTLTNCILWGNTASNGNEIYNNDVYGPDVPVFSYCDIAGCGGSGGGWDADMGTDGGGNIDANPLFIDVAGGDLHLQNTSPCINAGDNSAPSLPATDFEGELRIIHGIVDMGVDEVAGDVLFSLKVTIEPFPEAAAVTLDPAGGVYSFGAEVTITANAEDGYIFDHWSGNLSGNDNPVTITMDSHKHITAHFTFTGEIIYVDINATGLNNGIS